jgi:GT2 family glycosyltransferase
MTQAPVATVVVPTHARPAALARCLAALAALEPPGGAFEVVVVADGPDPAAAGAVTAAGAGGLPVRLLEQARSGPAAARNLGAAAAAGRWLAFTDDDCRPRPGWLRALVAALERAPDAVAGGTVRNAVAGSPAAEASQLVLDVAVAHFARAGDRAAFFPSNNLALGRERFAALGGFDPAFPLAAAEDRDLCDRALAAGLRLVAVPGAVVDHDHPLTVRRLWRQHRNYGRGAAVFARARAARGEERLQVAPGFYARLARAPFARARGPRALALAACVAETQLAYLAGYVAERRRLR